jgi:hypothetical protein
VGFALGFRVETLNAGFTRLCHSDALVVLIML